MEKLKQFFNPIDVYEAQRPLLLSCSMAGLLPIKLVGTLGHRRLEVSVFGFIVTSVHILLFFICFVLTIFSAESFVSYFFKSDISQLGLLLQLCISFFGTTISYTSCYLKKHRIIQIVNMLAHVDRRFVKLGIKQNYKDTTKFLLRFILINSIVHSIYVIGSYVILVMIAEERASAYAWVSYYTPTLLLSYFVFKLFGITMQIKNRFIHLNGVSVCVCNN